MKVTAVGFRPYDFEDRQTGRQVSGASLFYYGSNPDSEGLKGMEAGKLTIRSDTELYRKLAALDYSKPFEVEPKYEVNMKGRATLVDVIVQR